MTVFIRHLRDNIRGNVGWAVAIAAVAAMYSAFWPVFGDNSGLASAIDAFPKSVKDAFHMQDYATAAGYFGSTVFGLLVPILVAVFAITIGVRAIAGDEQAGTLDLVLAHPVGRVRLAVARFAAIVVAVVGAGVLLLVVVLGMRIPAGFTELGAANIAAICLQLVLFGICFASIAFGIGAFTGRKTIALGGAAYVAVAGYLADSFLPQIAGLHWIQRFSPFAWYLDGEPLVNGVQWGNCLLLVALGAVFAIAGIWRFNQRDLVA